MVNYYSMSSALANFFTVVSNFSPYFSILELSEHRDR
jgi:hypothetical protein